MNPAEKLISDTRADLFERGWTQKAFRRLDGSMCVAGALNRRAALDQNDWMQATPSQHPGYATAFSAILAECEPLGLFGFNDRDETTFDDVVNMLERAEKRAATGVPASIDFGSLSQLDAVACRFDADIGQQMPPAR